MPLSQISSADLAIFLHRPRDAELEVQTTTSSWHPKITPYRLLVLTTTIGLGSAKAIATFRNKSYVSTTIEWVAEIVVFIRLVHSHSRKAYMVTKLC